MITLYTLPPAFGLRNVSPFCLKAEMALTHLKQPFEIVFEADPRKAPKGKLPFVDIDGEIIADSELILQKLDNTYNGGLYGSLTPQEIAIGRSFTRLSEEHLYWMIVASRWLEDDWFPNVVSGFFAELPVILRSLIANSARSTVKKTYNLQGLGRHTKAEQQQFARDDLSAISDQIEAERYITGGRLTVFDFNIASILVGLMDNKPATWISVLAEDYPVLREYVDRVQKEVGVFAKE
jgi:glutathione S-transferase